MTRRRFRFAAGYATVTGMLLAMGTASAAALQPGGHIQEDSLHLGGYVQDDFLEMLRATRSPTAAMGDFLHGPQSIDVVRAADGLRFEANWNWHEANRLLTLRPDGRIDPGENGKYPAITVLPPGSFRLSGIPPHGTSHTYVYVGDVDRLVVLLALAGLYADPQGHRYMFGEDGILHGLGADTPFALNNDHVLGPRFDYFTLGSDKARIIAFRHQGNLLILYPVSRSHDSPSGIGEADFAHPMLVLHPVMQATGMTPGPHPHPPVPRG